MNFFSGLKAKKVPTKARAIIKAVVPSSECTTLFLHTRKASKQAKASKSKQAKASKSKQAKASKQKQAKASKQKQAKASKQKQASKSKQASTRLGSL
jgi:hypothetical protein